MRYLLKVALLPKLEAMPGVFVPLYLLKKTRLWGIRHTVGAL